jgi:SAM-dependent methyltransferase
MLGIDYRNSHTAPDKGMTYDRTFQDYPYRRCVWSWEKSVLKDVIEHSFQPDQDIRYLDFACGTGRIIGYVESLVNASIGVDVSDSMLQVGQQNVKKSMLLKADLTQHNILAGKTFDLITAFRFFLNAQPELRQEVISILANLLSDSGCLVFNIHMNEGSIAERLRRLSHRVKRLPKGKYHTLGRSGVLNMVQKAGLQVVGTYHFGLLPILDEKSKIPVPLINFIEENSSKISSLESASKYVIYVCRKDATSRVERSPSSFTL